MTDESDGSESAPEEPDERSDRSLDADRPDQSDAADQLGRSGADDSSSADGQREGSAGERASDVSDRSDDAGDRSSGAGGRSDRSAAAASDWRDRLEADGELSPAAVEAILDAHGDRGSRAIDAVGEGRVKEYQDFPVVVGNSDEYIVEDGACTCKDATYNLDAEDPNALCWHALAVEIAQRIDAVDSHDMYYSEVRDLL